MTARLYGLLQFKTPASRDRPTDITGLYANDSWRGEQISSTLVQPLSKESCVMVRVFTPHEGIGQSIPKGYSVRTIGEIRSKPTLFGLNYEYFREAA